MERKSQTQFLGYKKLKNREKVILLENEDSKRVKNKRKGCYRKRNCDNSDNAV